MRALTSSFAAAAIAALLFMPLGASAVAQEQGFAAEVTEVQYRHDGDRWGGRHHWRGRHGDWRHGGRHWRGGGHHWRPGRHHRYRHHGPSFGIIIAPPPIYYSRPRYPAPRPHYGQYGGGHVEWCYARYRSYRAYDNTYQPYHGPRRPCYSPYS